MREELLEIYSSSGKKTGKKATKSYIHKKAYFMQQFMYGFSAKKEMC